MSEKEFVQDLNTRQSHQKQLTSKIPSPLLTLAPLAIVQTQQGRATLHQCSTHEHRPLDRQKHGNGQASSHSPCLRTLRRGQSQAHLQQLQIRVPHLHWTTARRGLCRSLHGAQSQNDQKWTSHHVGTTKRHQRPLVCPIDAKNTSSQSNSSQFCIWGHPTHRHQARPHDVSPRLHLPSTLSFPLS